MKRTAAAAERNKQPILDVLRKYVNDAKKYFLEISSGTGQHIAYFAPSFPNVTFQPTEYDVDMLSSIQSWIEECPTKNIKQPMQVDITMKWSSWPWMHSITKNSVDYIYNANMIHITPFKCTVGLFTNASDLLKEDGLLITYGPYGQNGIIYPESNVSFDKGLRLQNPEWGIRDINDLESLAVNKGLLLTEIVDMPANNKILIWKKIKVI